MTPLIRLYFSVRFLFPRPARLFVRRLLAKRKREQLAAVWPINPATAAKPADWKGWPEHKDFAFMLTHDVEGERGLKRVKALAKLEMELGFRSAFFFVPEGAYSVPMELVEWLQGNGFEVAVHDLHHDGKLFDSKEGFQTAARRINHYLMRWGAVGYRSAFMLHNLKWQHHLDIEYDASTFDVDPFEPQPDAANTIFPYWVANEERSPVLTESGANDARNIRDGYVELPYSIPQDSTVYLLFRERTTDIWKRKLDWVAEQGGMALLNVHPDYVELEGKRPSFTEFPAQLYKEFLMYVRDKYKGRYWHPLPKELARWTATRPIEDRRSQIEAWEETRAVR